MYILDNVFLYKSEIFPRPTEIHYNKDFLFASVSHDTKKKKDKTEKYICMALLKMEKKNTFKF